MTLKEVPKPWGTGRREHHAFNLWAYNKKQIGPHRPPQEWKGDKVKMRKSLLGSEGARASVLLKKAEKVVASRFLQFELKKKKNPNRNDLSSSFDVIKN